MPTSSGYVQPSIATPPRPPSQQVVSLPSVRPAFVTPGPFTLLPPSPQYVPLQPAPYRLVGTHSQELPLSGLTYQIVTPQHHHPGSGTAVQLITAAPVPEVYAPPQHTTYLQPESAESEPIVHLNVDPKSGAAMYGSVEAGYQVIQPSAVGDGSLSYAMPSCDMTQHASSRLYEDTAEYNYPPQSTMLVTTLHPASSRPVLTGSLRQPLPVIISGQLSFTYTKCQSE